MFVSWEYRDSTTYDLQLDPLALKLDGADLEVDSDSGDEGRRPGVVAEPEEQAGLSDTCQREYRLVAVRTVPRDRSKPKLKEVEMRGKETETHQSHR
jgi:hypothetical protein